MRDRPARRAPREPGDLDREPLLFGIGFGEPGPGNLRIGEDDGRDGRRLEHRLVPGDGLHRHPGLV